MRLYEHTSEAAAAARAASQRRRRLIARIIEKSMPIIPEPEDDDYPDDHDDGELEQRNDVEWNLGGDSPLPACDDGADDEVADDDGKVEGG